AHDVERVDEAEPGRESEARRAAVVGGAPPHPEREGGQGKAGENHAVLLRVEAKVDRALAPPRKPGGFGIEPVGQEVPVVGDAPKEKGKEDHREGEREGGDGSPSWPPGPGEIAREDGREESAFRARERGQPGHEAAGGRPASSQPRLDGEPTAKPPHDDAAPTPN